MSKIVIYYSMTGNTKEIAEKIAYDLSSECVSVSNISVCDALKYDEIILGCPAMGAEELEEEELQPFYNELVENSKTKIKGLFGSYGWGDGEWMRTWEADYEAKTGNAIGTLIINGGVESIDEEEYEIFLEKLR